MERNQDNIPCFFYMHKQRFKISRLTMDEDYCSSHLHYLPPAIQQPSAQSLTASAAPALGRTHADQLIKNHLVKNTNKAVSLWLALGIGVRGEQRRGSMNEKR